MTYQHTTSALLLGKTASIAAGNVSQQGNTANVTTLTGGGWPATNGTKLVWRPGTQQPFYKPFLGSFYDMLVIPNCKTVRIGTTNRSPYF